MLQALIRRLIIELKSIFRGPVALSNVSATIGGTFSKPSIKLNTDEVVKNAVTNVIASEVLGVDAEDIEAQKAAIRKQAE